MSGVRRSVLIGAGVVLAVVAIVLVSFVVTVRRPIPSYGGTVEVPGLTQEVRVLRDGQGVPQIYGPDPQSLFYAQGYVQAQDRFFQMDVRRHISSGRLSELVGTNPTALASDQMVRTMGWRRVAEAELPLLSGETRNHLQAYADGVNAYVGSKSPAELSVNYVALGTRVDLDQIEPWTPVDSLAWLKAMAWDARSNYDGELGRALAYANVNDVNLVNSLYPAYPGDGPTILAQDPPPAAAAAPARAIGASTPSPAPAARPQGQRRDSPEPSDGAVEKLSEMSAQLGALRAALASVGAGEQAELSGSSGSNAIVVSGDLTASGKPLLAADPHLAPTTPSVWSQSGLHCTKVGQACPFDVSGFTEAAVPGVLVGQNSTIAWANAALGADTSDFFLERLVGDTYDVDGQSRPVQTRTEKIKVAGADDVELTVRSTGHGPIVSDVMPDARRGGAVQPGRDLQPVLGDYAVALGWTGLTPGRTMDAIFALNTARDWASFRGALQLYSAPSEGFVYADTKGHIGFQAAGLVPTRPEGRGRGQSDGTWPREGWDSSWDWTGTIPPASMPGELDPARGYVVAANQKVSPGSGLTQDWDYGYRAARIETLLKEKTGDGGKLTRDGLREIQNDTFDAFAQQVLVPALLTTPPSDIGGARDREFTMPALQMLSAWDGRHDVDSPGAAYYNGVYSNLVRRTFGDQLADGFEPTGDARTGEIMKTMLAQPNNPWWDDVSTPTIVENRDQIVSQELVDARLELTAKLGKDPQTWRWGRLHTLTPRLEPLDTAEPTLSRALLNSDRLEVGGSSTTVNLSAWDASSVNYASEVIASMRMVIDLDKPNTSTWVDFTGVSGNRGSRHYSDQTERWLTTEQYPWLTTRAALEDADATEQTLKPAPASN